jgi:hypothetical protein
MEPRKHIRTISPEESAELEELVFDLVRERLLKAVGAGGMWTLQFRSNTDTDSLFGETISEYIARDIADQIAAPSAFAAESSADEAESLQTGIADVDADEQPPIEHEVAVEHDVAVESAEQSDAPAPAEAADAEFDEADDHRMFKPRQAA